jgi:hypothetical protein
MASNTTVAAYPGASHGTSGDDFPIVADVAARAAEGRPPGTGVVTSTIPCGTSEPCTATARPARPVPNRPADPPGLGPTRGCRRPWEQYVDREVLAVSLVRGHRRRAPIARRCRRNRRRPSRRVRATGTLPARTPEPLSPFRQPCDARFTPRPRRPGRDHRRHPCVTADFTDPCHRWRLPFEGLPDGRPDRRIPLPGSPLPERWSHRPPGSFRSRRPVDRAGAGGCAEQQQRGRHATRRRRNPPHGLSILFSMPV